MFNEAGEVTEYGKATEYGNATEYGEYGKAGHGRPGQGGPCEGPLHNSLNSSRTANEPTILKILPGDAFLRVPDQAPGESRAKKTVGLTDLRARRAVTRRSGGARGRGAWGADFARGRGARGTDMRPLCAPANPGCRLLPHLCATREPGPAPTRRLVAVQSLTR